MTGNRYAEKLRALAVGALLISTSLVAQAQTTTPFGDTNIDQTSSSISLTHGTGASTTGIVIDSSGTTASGNLVADYLSANTIAPTSGSTLNISASNVTVSSGVSGSPSTTTVENLAVTGTTSLQGDTSITGVTSLNGDTTINGATMINGATTINGALNMSGNRITNVADGVADTDAVNLRQLNAVSSQIESIQKEARAGISAVAAMNAIPGIAPGNKAAMGVGVGSYKGSSAIAFGMSARLGNHSAVKLSVGKSSSDSDSGLVGSVGMGVSW